LAKSRKKSKSRKAIPFDVKIAVLTEAGYKCGVPICRNVLALDLHHMVHVAEGGEDVVENLLALCSYCHDLYHRGEIKRESIFAWKSMLVSLTRAFDVGALDQLLFLNKPESTSLRVSGDGVLSFTRLIAGGLATFKLNQQNGPLLLYSIGLTTSGKQLVSAWSKGDRKAVKKVLSEKSALSGSLNQTAS
jgi:hypothetical protein